MARRKLLKPDETRTLFGIPDDEESLIRHYTLSPDDRLEAMLRRRSHNQLGFAVQLCVMRHPGRILRPDEQPPSAMVAYVAEQLAADPAKMSPYAQRIQTRFDHSRYLERYIGVHTMARADRRAGLLAAIDEAMATDKGLPIATAIVDAFRKRGVLLPSEGTLERIGLTGRAIARRRTEAALLSDFSSDRLEECAAVVRWPSDDRHAASRHQADMGGDRE